MKIRKGGQEGGGKHGPALFITTVQSGGGGQRNCHMRLPLGKAGLFSV